MDVLIVGRGGGSLEDLWPFNDEKVARAIAECAVPVISAVGHETDFTIADFVADLRAPTPSAAAELVVRARAEFVERVESLQDRLARVLRYRLAVALGRLSELGAERALGVVRRKMDRASQRTDELDFRLRERMRALLLAAERRLAAVASTLRAQDPRMLLAARRERLQNLGGTLESLMRLKLMRLGGRLESLAAQLGHLSPLAVLDRGYALVQDEQGRLIRRASETAPGRRLRVRLHEGKLGVEVREIE